MVNVCIEETVHLTVVRKREGRDGVLVTQRHILEHALTNLIPLLDPTSFKRLHHLPIVSQVCQQDHLAHGLLGALEIQTIDVPVVYNEL